MNSPFTYTPPEIESDLPGWMVAAILAIPVLLVVLDILGGC